MNEKILLVDDEEANLRLLTQWLIPLGYEIDLAANGDEAVRKVQENRPDLIILDTMSGAVPKEPMSRPRYQVSGV